MKAFVQLIARQSGIIALLCMTFALLQGLQVCEGLWQGCGLHGDFIQPHAKGGLHIVSVSFVNMLAALGLAMPFGLIALWQGGVRRKLGKAGVVENPGRENVLRTKKRQRRRR